MWERKRKSERRRERELWQTAKQVIYTDKETEVLQ